MKKQLFSNKISWQKQIGSAHANASCACYFLEDGSYVKRSDGEPDGERRSCFTGSDVLIGAIQKAETNIQSINKERKEKGLEPLQLYPLDTTIVKVGKCFQFK